MKYLSLSRFKEECRLPFYLAVEEWAAKCLPDDEYFFAWRVSPTVICGRNQDMSTEVDMAYCRAAGIDVVRRRSGGGCVYADRNNWMFSYITPCRQVSDTFGRYTAMIARMLGSLGIEAEPSGRNDLTIGGLKVAGNAFYHLPGKAIVHGTMLCRIDYERMSRAITPSRAKLESKAVKSVPARVTSLSEHNLPIAIDELGDYAARFLCGAGEGRRQDACSPLWQYELTDADIAAVREIEKGYYEPEFLYRKQSRYDIERSRRFEGVGEIKIGISGERVFYPRSLCNAARPTLRVRDIDFTGDFFPLGDLEALKAAFVGLPLEELPEKARDIDIGKYIANLKQEDFISLLIP